MASAFADAIFVAEADRYLGLSQLREWLAEDVVSDSVLEDVELLEDGLVNWSWHHDYIYEYDGWFSSGWEYL